MTIHPTSPVVEPVTQVHYHGWSKRHDELIELGCGRLSVDHLVARPASRAGNRRRHANRTGTKGKEVSKASEAEAVRARAEAVRGRNAASGGKAEAPLAHQPTRRDGRLRSSLRAPAQPSEPVEVSEASRPYRRISAAKQHEPQLERESSAVRSPPTGFMPCTDHAPTSACGLSPQLPYSIGERLEVRDTYTGELRFPFGLGAPPDPEPNCALSRSRATILTLTRAARLTRRVARSQDRRAAWQRRRCSAAQAADPLRRMVGQV